MTLQKSIASLSAIAVCAFAVCTAHAQTNIATFNATMTIQQPVVDGNNTQSAASKSTVLNTAGLIAEIGLATGQNPAFSKAAKLAVISGNGPSSQFEVIDGANIVTIETNIINIFPTTGNSVISGKQTPSIYAIKELMVFEMDFNDVGMGASDLQFSLRGIGSIAMTETASSSSQSAKMALVGDGTIGPDATNFVATATLTGSAK